VSAILVRYISFSHVKYQSIKVYQICAHNNSRPITKNTKIILNIRLANAPSIIGDGDKQPSLVAAAMFNFTDDADARCPVARAQFPMPTTTTTRAPEPRLTLTASQHEGHASKRARTPKTQNVDRTDKKPAPAILLKLI